MEDYLIEYAEDADETKRLIKYDFNNQAFKDTVKALVFENLTSECILPPYSLHYIGMKQNPYCPIPSHFVFAIGFSFIDATKEYFVRSATNLTGLLERLKGLKSEAKSEQAKDDYDAKIKNTENTIECIKRYAGSLLDQESMYERCVKDIYEYNDSNEINNLKFFQLIEREALYSYFISCVFSLHQQNKEKYNKEPISDEIIQSAAKQFIQKYSTINFIHVDKKRSTNDGFEKAIASVETFNQTKENLKTDPKFIEIIQEKKNASKKRKQFGHVQNLDTIVETELEKEPVNIETIKKELVNELKQYQSSNEEEEETKVEVVDENTEQKEEEEEDEFFDVPPVMVMAQQQQVEEGETPPMK